MNGFQGMDIAAWITPQTAAGALAALAVSVVVQLAIARLSNRSQDGRGGCGVVGQAMPSASSSSSIPPAVGAQRGQRPAGGGECSGGDRVASVASPALAGGPPASPDIAETEPPRDINTPPPVIQRMAEARRARRMLRPEVAVRQFLDFLRERGHTGWFAAEHIDEMWIWFCDVHSIVPIDAVIVRSELAAIPACRHQAGKRLNTPEFIHVREALGGRSRAAVYYVPSQPIDVESQSLSGQRQLPDRTETGTVTGPGGGGQGGGRVASGSVGGGAAGQASGRKPGTTAAGMKSKARTGGSGAASAPAARPAHDENGWRSDGLIAA
jgi:hypothetical protein